MIWQWRVAPFTMLNASLGSLALSDSPICIYGMKVLARATGGIDITLRKFVTWAVEVCDREARDKKSDFR